MRAFQATKREMSHGKTLTWLRKLNLKRETESLQTSVQTTVSLRFSTDGWLVSWLFLYHINL